VADVEDGSIVGWRWVARFWWLGRIVRTFAEKEMTSSTRSSFGFRKIGSIAVGPEIHVAGVIADFGVGMTGSVVEKLTDCIQCCLGAVGLGGRDRSKGDEHGGVYAAGVPEKSANNFLDELLFFRCQRMADIDGVCELLLGAVIGGQPAMRRVFISLGERVFKTL